MENDPSIRPLTGAKSPDRPWDEVISELAQGQHGVISRVQLIERGMKRRAIAGRLDRGQLHRLHHGVYKVGYRRISRRGRWMAAVLAAGEGAVLSHRSAARMWRLMPPAAEWPEVATARRRVRRSGIVVHESQIADDEWLVEDGIPVTSPFRTIYDLAAVVKMRELERAFHEAEALQLRDRVSLPMLLERYPGRRGTRKVRALLEPSEPEGFTRNDFEEAFRALVVDRGLPRPWMNVPLSIRGRLFEVDALWEEQRVAVELDSHRIHGTRKKFESDKQRDRILQAEGYRTIRITWRQLQEEPDEIVADLRLALEQPVPTHTHSAR
jgi:Transcriptional regulator, AbiEi antitoxin/Protein of unknown function (DUF559)